MPGHELSPAVDLGRIAPALRQTCGDYLRTYRLELEEAIRAGVGGVEVSRRYARSLDGLLGALFCAADAALRGSEDAPRGRVSLVAVGGYGRELVALHSDVDVLFLCDEPSDPHVARLAEAVLYPLWDLGLTIGHAVRGVEETLALSRADIRTATTLLDLRRIAGDAAIVRDLEARSRTDVLEPSIAEFLDALAADTEQRHDRFGGSLYLLEPEVKLGRGGLRDLDVTAWAANARWGVPLARTEALLDRELDELWVAQEMLFRVRNLLHYRAGRRQDRLTFADQEEIARQLGFVDGVVLGVEQFMQAYYRHARIVAQTAERILERARPRPDVASESIVDLGDGCSLVDGHAGITDASRLEGEPVIALRLYRHVVARDLPPDPAARDVIARAAVGERFAQKLGESTEAHRLFLELLSSRAQPPVRRGSILGELHEVGLMLALLPEFEPVTGRVIHDVYHVYTVDVHAVAAVDRLRALVRGDDKRDLPLACRLAAEAPRREPLFLAVLLHDIGKAHGHRKVERGAEIARSIAERLELGPADSAHVAWLVRQHLSLFHWATRRDTSDPETITELARQVGTPERLRDLYLMTVAVVSTTNPTAMTAWKARMLEDLYLALAAALDGGETRSRSARASEVRDEVRVGFVGDAGRDTLDAFVDAMPNRYLLANPADAIRAHARIARDRADRPVHVAATPGPAEGIAELIVVTDDRPGLLAQIAAVLAKARLDVVAAQIYTRSRGDQPREAFDVFHVRREGEDVSVLQPAVLEGIRADLASVLGGEIAAADLIERLPKKPSWARRHTPDVETEVIIDNAVSPRFTVVDVFTRDRTGLLYAIADRLHREGVSIAVSRISTEGARAADVFYVTDPDGNKLQGDERLEGLRDAVGRSLVGFHALWENH